MKRMTKKHTPTLSRSKK